MEFFIIQIKNLHMKAIGLTMIFMEKGKFIMHIQKTYRKIILLQILDKLTIFRFGKVMTANF